MKRQYYIPTIVIFAVGVGTSGCASQVKVVDYRCGGTEQMIASPLTATCTLLTGDHARIESTTIAKGERIGFARCGGDLQAVAGDQRIVLNDGTYLWVAEPSGRALQAQESAGVTAACAATSLLGSYLLSPRLLSSPRW